MKKIKYTIPSAIFVFSSFLTYGQPTEAPKLPTTPIDLGNVGGVTIEIPSLEELQANPVPQVAALLPMVKGMIAFQGEEFYKYQFVQKFLPKDSLFMDLIDQNGPMLASLPFAVHSNFEKAALVGLAKKYGLAKDIKSSTELTDQAKADLQKQLQAQFIPKGPITDEMARRFAGQTKIKILEFHPLLSNQKHTIDIKSITNQILRDLNKGTSFESIAEKYIKGTGLVIRAPQEMTLQRDEAVFSKNGKTFYRFDIPFTPIVNAKEGQIITIRRQWSILNNPDPLTDFNVPVLQGMALPRRAEPGVIICKVVKFMPLPFTKYKNEAVKIKNEYRELAARKAYQTAYEDYMHTAPINPSSELNDEIQPLNNLIQEVKGIETIPTYELLSGKVTELHKLDNLLMSLTNNYIKLIDAYYNMPDIKELKERPNLAHLEILLKSMLNELLFPFTGELKTPVLRNFYTDIRINNLRPLMLINPPVRAHLELAKMLALKDNPETTKHLTEYLDMNGLSFSSVFPLDKPMLEARAKSIEDLISQMKERKIIDDQKAKELNDLLSKKKEEALKTLS